MQKKDDLKNLIDNPLQPNASEWAMKARKILKEEGLLSKEAEKHINNIINHNGAFDQHNNALTYILKEAYKEKYENISIPDNKNSKQIFVAMRFSDEQEGLYKNVIKPVAKKSNYVVTKVNDEEFEGSIIDKIKSDISSSICLIADLTDNRGGVYYEAGIAKGLQMCNHSIKLILACKKVFFETEGVHFDVQGDNIILYESEEDYKQKLEARLKSILNEK